MSKVRIGVAAAMLAAVFAAAGAHAETITLNAALGMAYETNPNLDASRAQQRATDENVAKANAGWRPQINATGQYGWQKYMLGQGALGPGTSGDINSHPLEGQVTITEPIFRGGKTYAEIGQAKAVVRQGRAQLIASEQQTLLNGVAAYMNVVRDTVTVKLQESNVAVLQKQLDATTKQFNVGELTKTDVSQSQARLSGAQSQLTLARGRLASDRAVFQQIIGRMPEALEDRPALPTLPKTEDQAIEIGVKFNPQIVGAREAERAADYAVDDALGSLAPQVSIQGQYQYQKGSLTTGIGSGGPDSPALRGVSVMGQVTVPIYQGGAEEATVRQAKQTHGQAQLLVLAADQQVRADVQSTWEAYVSATAAIASNEAQVVADETAFEGVQKEEQVGSRTILDVLNAQQELLNAQVAVVSSRRDAYVAAYQLLASTGQLTAKYLGLKVKLYDPKEYYNDNASRWIGLGD